MYKKNIITIIKHMYITPFYIFLSFSNHKTTTQSLLIQISCNDGLPQKICTDCFSKFCTVSSFRLQCLEAQTVLSNIFDKIDTQSIQDDEVFEGFANEQDNYNNEPIKQNIIKTAIGAKTATETANSTTITTADEAVDFKTIEQTFVGDQEEGEVEKTEKSTKNGNNSNNNNGEYVQL